jgi:hypothetical protein
LYNVLKSRFTYDSSIIKVKKIIKNKKKRKRYAIKRTKRLHAAHPVKKFYTSFVVKSIIGKKKKTIRNSARRRQLQRIKFILRLRFFRKEFSVNKKNAFKKTRLIKNLIYFSHSKLRNECKSLNEFKELNFNRKRFLTSIISPNSTNTNTVHNGLFITQNTKT